MALLYLLLFRPTSILVCNFLSSDFFILLQTHSGMWLTLVSELSTMHAHGPEMVAAECFNNLKLLVSENITSLGIKSFHTHAHTHIQLLPHEIIHSDQGDYLGDPKIMLRNNRMNALAWNEPISCRC